MSSLRLVMFYAHGAPLYYRVDAYFYFTFVSRFAKGVKGICNMFNFIYNIKCTKFRKKDTLDYTPNHIYVYLYLNITICQNVLLYICHSDNYIYFNRLLKNNFEVFAINDFLTVNFIKFISFRYIYIYIKKVFVIIKVTLI